MVPPIFRKFIKLFHSSPADPGRLTEPTEEKFKSLLEASPDALLIVDPGGKIARANRQAEALFGYRRSEMAGLAVELLIPERYREKHREKHARFFREGGMRPMGSGTEFFALRKDGSEFPVDISLSPLKTDGVTMVIAAVRNRIERDRIERELREKSADLQLLQVTAAASNQAVNLDEALQICLTAVCLRTGWPVGHVYLLSADGRNNLVPSDIWYMERPGFYEDFRAATRLIAVKPGQSLVGNVLEEGIPMALSDVRDEGPYPRTKIASALGLKGTFAFPILDGEAVVAVMEFFSTEPILVGHRFLELLGHVGVQLGRVAERLRASRNLENSEKHFRALIENGQDIVILSEADGVIRYISPSVQRIKGHSPAELRGRNLFEYTHPDDVPAVARMTAEILSGPGATRSGKFRFRHKDGSWRVLESIATNLLDDPIVHGIVINSRDVTEQEEAQAALAEREERFRSVIQSSSDAVLVLDGPGREILTWSRGAEAIFGYSEGEILGKPITLLISGKDWPVRRDEWEMAGDQGRGPAGGMTLELNGIRKDGSAFPIELSLSSWMTGSHRFFGAIIRDISDRKIIHELARSNKELEQFAYLASHDLQEPLRMVASYVQLLARRYQGQLDENANQYIEQAADGAKRMQTLINDLLSYSRVGSRGKPFADVKCEDILVRAVSNLESAVRLTEAKVTHDPLPVVHGDFNLLVQLFQNLIGNGIKFHGKSKPHIHVQAERSGPDWVISIRDNGIGLDPQYSDKIFDVFRRLHSRSEYEGTGIGLAICKKVVIQHGGRIWVESEEGQGATFRFTMPGEKGNTT